jgi:hypothetical protein
MFMSVTKFSCAKINFSVQLGLYVETAKNIHTRIVHQKNVITILSVSDDWD